MPSAQRCCGGQREAANRRHGKRNCALGPYRRAKVRRYDGKLRIGRQPIAADVSAIGGPAIAAR